MKALIVFSLLSLSVFAEQKSCQDLEREICPNGMSMECMTNNMGKIPQACLSEIMESAASSHPCMKQLNTKDAELSKECKEYFGEQEKLSSDFSKSCPELNQCAQILSKSKDPVKARQEYQSCLLQLSKESSKACAGVVN